MDPVSFLGRCRDRYGDLFTTRFIFAEPGACISDPQAIQEILSAPPDRFDSGKMNQITIPLLGERLLLVLDGAEHTRQRRLSMPAFHGKQDSHANLPTL